MTQDEAASALLAHVFAGALGPTNGKGVAYALLESTPTAFSWSAALEDLDEAPGPIDRYLIRIDRYSKEISSPKLIQLSEEEISEALLSATGHHLSSSTRFTDGALSISYKAFVKEDPDIAYVIQLRHHGNVASMDAIMGYISRTINKDNLPVTPVYPIPGEKNKQQATGMGRQITRLVPGSVASSVYPGLPHDRKLVLIRQMALAYQACWSLTLPSARLIGEIVATTVDSEVVLDVKPDRHHGLGGPFSSVRKYLEAYIKSRLEALEKQEGIEEFKSTYLERIKSFVDTRLQNSLPTSVENVPIVFMHSDMGLHNVIVSDELQPEIKSIVDWEFVASAPFPSLYRIIEGLFRQPATNGFGPEYEHASELRQTFWETIPTWKRRMESDSAQDFLEWFRLGLFMKPEWRPENLFGDEANGYWRENIRVVEGVLKKYG